jgi:hypothetical protein
MILALCLLAVQDAELARLEFFEKKVRPLLAERCYKCHSSGGESVKGGLLLDSRDGILRGGHSGPAVVPGDPDRSPLVRAVRGSDEEIRMPPKSRLAAAEIADLETWVRMGAPAPADASEARPRIDFAAARRFWSFRPVGPRAGTIDGFILAKLEEKGLSPAPEADPRTLLRRATFDLTGLPPTPEEMEAFLADPSPEAYARGIDRLLASPQYGERWGRHWLDLVRYADTAGDSADYPIPQAHKYRDYVVDSFNSDKPYDRFIREQVAGDLSGTRDGIVATGFLALARRFGEEPTADHHLTIDDTIDTLGRTVLGLTLSCARCHDHKFDPITTDDYFALYGILQSTRYPHSGGDKMKYQKDFVPLVPREEAERILRPFEEKLAALDREAKPLEEEIAARERELAGGKAEPRKDERSLQDLRKALGEIRKKRETLAKQRPAIDDACAVADGEPANARLHLKGNPKALGREVPRRFLELLGGQPVTAGSGRRELAEALTSASNPLTARVMANRIWQRHFGKGLVRTPSYFGHQGLAPTHPELLDFLAAELVRSGWSVKSMHRSIMTSRAYRRACGSGAAADLFGAFERRRLDAEAIRDSILAVSGSLDRTAGGPHPFPPAKDWAFSKASPFYAVYPTERRSLYLMQQRLKRHPYLALFDGPDPNASTAERLTTTTPLQSLFMLNSPFVHEQAGRFAARVQAAAADDPARIDLAHRLAFGRPASDAELQLGRGFLDRAGWTSYAKVLLSSNEFIHVE